MLKKQSRSSKKLIEVNQKSNGTTEKEKIILKLTKKENGKHKLNISN